MYDTHMSTPGNTAKLGTAHSNIQTAQRGPSLVGSEPAMHWSVGVKITLPFLWGSGFYLGRILSRVRVVGG